MEVSIYSRKAIGELIEKGFPQNTAVISFYTPKNKRDCEENRVNYDGVCNKIFYVGIPDIDIEILSDVNAITDRAAPPPALRRFFNTLKGVESIFLQIIGIIPISWFTTKYLMHLKKSSDMRGPPQII